MEWWQGEKDTWRTTSVSRSLHGTDLDRTWWEMENFGSEDSCVSRATLIFGSTLPPMLAQVLTDLSTESQSPLDL